MQQNCDYEDLKEQYLQQLRKASIDISKGKQVQVQEFLYSIINKDYDKLIQEYKNLNKEICKVIIYGHDLQNTTQALNILQAFLYFYIGSKLKIEELINNSNDKIWDCYFIRCFYYIEKNIIKSQLYKEKFEQLLTLNNKNYLASDWRQSESKLENFRNGNQIADFFIHTFENDNTVTEKNKKKHFVQSFNFLNEHNLISDIKDKTKRLKINIINACLTKDYQYLKDLQVEDKKSLVITLYQLVIVDYKQFSVFLSRCNDKDRNDLIQHVLIQVDAVDQDHFKLVQVGRSLRKICEWEKTIDLYEELIKSSEYQEKKQLYNVYLYFTISKLQFMKGELKLALGNCQLALEEIIKLEKLKLTFYQPNPNRLLQMELLFLSLVINYILKDNKSKIMRIKQISNIITLKKIEIWQNYEKLIIKNESQNKINLQLLFQYFLEEIEIQDISKVQYAQSSFDKIRKFFESQIEERQFKLQNKAHLSDSIIQLKEIKLKTQCLLELFIIAQFLKNQEYQIVYYLKIECLPLLLSMIQIKDLAILPVVQAQIFKFFGEYEKCFIIAQNLENQKIMAEVYFATQNEDKAIEYFENLQDYDSQFILGYLYFNKSSQMQGKQLQQKYINLALNSFQKAKQFNIYLNPLQETLKKIQFQKEIDQRNDEIKQSLLLLEQDDVLIHEQNYPYFKVRDDILAFYKEVKNELAPHYNILIPQIEQFLLSSRRYQVESKTLLEGMKFESLLKNGKNKIINRVIFEGKQYAQQISSITFNAKKQQFTEQQLKLLYSRINELNILSDLQDHKIPYVIQNQHIGFEIKQLDDQGLKIIQIFNLTPYYEPFQVIQQQNDKQKLQFAEKIAISLKQLQMRIISHQDIKPENVMVDQFIDPVLIDFDISIQNMRSSINRSCSNSQIYVDLDIEQSGQKCRKNDVYQFGIILYELFVGRRPFDDLNYQTQTEFLSYQIHLDEISKIHLPKIKQLINSCTVSNVKERLSLSQVLFQFLMINKCRSDVMKLLEIFMVHFSDIDINDQEYELIKDFQQITYSIPQMEQLQIQKEQQMTLHKCEYQSQQLLFYKNQIFLQNRQLAFLQILQCMRFIRNHLYLNKRNVQNITEFYNFKLILQEIDKQESIQFDIFCFDNNYQLDYLSQPKQLVSLLETIDQINKEGIYIKSLEYQLILDSNSNPVIFNLLFSQRQKDDVLKNQDGWPCENNQIMKTEENYKDQACNVVNLIIVFLQRVLIHFKRVSLSQNSKNNSQLQEIIENLIGNQKYFSNINKMIQYLTSQSTENIYNSANYIRSDIKQFCELAYKFLVPHDCDLENLIVKFVRSTQRYKVESSEINSSLKVDNVKIGSGNYGVVNRVQFKGKDYASKISTVSFKQNQVDKNAVSELKQRLNEINILSEIQDFQIPYVLQNIHIGFRFTFQENDNIYRIKIYNLTPIYQDFSIIQKLEDLEMKIQFASKIALCLKQLQMRKISHQDIKPDNLMVDDNLDPVIIDFGISVSNFKSRISKLKICTLQYADPELMDGNKKSRKNDVYSFGVTLYELFTRSKPINDLSQEFLQIQAHIDNIKQIQKPEIQELIINCVQPYIKNRYSLSQVLFQFLITNLCRKDIVVLLKLFLDYFDDIDITDQEYDLIKDFQEISLLIPQMDSEEIQQVEQLNDNLYKCQYQDNPLLFTRYQITIENKQLAFIQILQCMRFVRNLLHLNRRNVNNITWFCNYRLFISKVGLDKSVQFEIFSYNKNYNLGYLTNSSQFVSLLTTMQQIHENGIYMMNFEDKQLLFQNDEPIIVDFIYSFRKQDDLYKNSYGWPCNNSLNYIELNYSNELQMIQTYFKSLLCDLDQLSQNIQQVQELKQKLLRILETYSLYTNLQQIVDFLLIENLKQSQNDN